MFSDTFMSYPILNQHMIKAQTPTQQAMAGVRQPLAVTDVEPQVVSLVGGWILVLMQQDHKADVSSDRHSYIRLSHNGH